MTITDRYNTARGYDPNTRNSFTCGLISANDLALDTVALPDILPVTFNGGYLDADANSSYDFELGDFAIEFWMRPANVTGVKTLFDFSDSSRHLAVLLDGATLRVISSDTVTSVTMSSAATPITVNGFSNADDLEIFVNDKWISPTNFSLANNTVTLAGSVTIVNGDIVRINRKHSNLSTSGILSTQNYFRFNKQLAVNFFPLLIVVCLFCKR